MDEERPYMDSHTLMMMQQLQWLESIGIKHLPKNIETFLKKSKKQNNAALLHQMSMPLAQNDACTYVMKEFINQHLAYENILDQYGIDFFRAFIDDCPMFSELIVRLNILTAKYNLSLVAQIVLIEIMQEDIFRIAIKYKQVDKVCINQIKEFITRQHEQYGKEIYYRHNEFTIYAFYYLWKYVTEKKDENLTNAIMFMHLSKAEKVQKISLKNRCEHIKLSSNKTHDQALNKWIYQQIDQYFIDNADFIETQKNKNEITNILNLCTRYIFERGYIEQAFSCTSSSGKYPVYIDKNNREYLPEDITEEMKAECKLIKKYYKTTDNFFDLALGSKVRNYTALYNNIKNTTFSNLRSNKVKPYIAKQYGITKKSV